MHISGQVHTLTAFPTEKNQPRKRVGGTQCDIGHGCEEKTICASVGNSAVFVTARGHLFYWLIFTEIVVDLVVADVLKDHSAFILRVKQSKSDLKSHMFWAGWVHSREVHILGNAWMISTFSTCTVRAQTSGVICSWKLRESNSA